jgi:hypothetical protein
MKKAVFIFIIIFIFNHTGFTQEKLPDRANKFSYGFHLLNYQQDFGIGLQLTSPYIARGWLAFRGRANYQFNQHLNDVNETTWSGFGSYQLGVVGVAGMAGGFARFYAEGGVILLTPPVSISSNDIEFGGYGVFGFEFFMSTSPNVPVSYFIELGGMGVGAVADKVPGKPIYSNGFTISVGFRGYIK